MLSTAERVCALTTREVRLLARSRARLLRALAVPLAGGIVCGWITQRTALPPVYCLAAFLMLGSIVFAADHRTRASRALSAITGLAVFDSAWVAAACLVLIAQAAVLVTSASLIGGLEIPTGILAGVILISLAASALIHRFLPGD